MKHYYYHSLKTIFLSIIFSSFLFPQTVLHNIVNEVNSDSLMHFVKELSGNIPTTINGSPYTILSRHKNQPGNDMAMQYIKQKLDSYGLTTTIQTFSATGKNIYGVKTGTEFPNQKYMICAHFDDMPTGSLAPGADDNASGTAAVIEAARVLKDYTFPYTLIFALWDEEEQGLVGSAYYATQAQAAGDSIRGVINLDMIAFDSNNDSKADIHTRPVGSSLLLWEKMVELNTSLSVGLTLAVKNPGSTYSDHASFWSKGYGAILLIEDGNDFHTQYHTINDNISYFNIPYYHKNSKLAIATLAYFGFNLNMSISHTAVASSGYTGDINTTASIITGLELATGSNAPSLYYRTAADTVFSPFTRIIGTPITDGIFNYNFAIPSQALGTRVQYYIAAQDVNAAMCVTSPAGGSGTNPPGSIPPLQLYEFFVANSSIVMADSAMNMNNWTASGGWGTTSAKYVSAPYSFTESPGGNYGTNVTAIFQYNSPIDLTNILGASLEFKAQWDIENNWDYGQIQVSTNNGTTWIALEGQYTNPGTGTFQPNGQPLYDGTMTSWVTENINLTPYKNKIINLRFYFRSDNAVQQDGWYIDDIVVNKYEAVPVELVSFTAKSSGSNVLLEWHTSTELNNYGFEIQRASSSTTPSQDMQDNWKSIAFVEGKGTTTGLNYYSYSDKPEKFDNYYYRLIQTDYDGTTKTYGPVNIDLTKSLSFVLEQNYPNPFNPATIIKFTISDLQFTSLKIYDIIGNEVAVLINEIKEPGNYEAKFDASLLSSGVYFYTLKAGDFIQIKKMQLIK